jgi:hypothetical protein
VHRTRSPAAWRGLPVEALGLVGVAVAALREQHSTGLDDHDGVAHAGEPTQHDAGASPDLLSGVGEWWLIGAGSSSLDPLPEGDDLRERGGPARTTNRGS